MSNLKALSKLHPINEYELTLTLKPRLYKYKPQEQYDICYQMLRNIVNAYPFEFSIVAELTQDMNVHYHCMVNVPDLTWKSYLLNLFRKHSTYFGRKTISVLMNYHTWKAYMIKDIKNTQVSIKDPIVSNQHDLFDKLFAPIV